MEAAWEDTAEPGRTIVDFRKEMWHVQGKALDPGRLQSIWGRKLELATRTGFAALLTAVYAILPQVQDASWQAATVFAPVCAICAVSGPNLGETLHHGTEYIRGALLGALTSTVVNECLRPIGDPHVREMIAWASFICATLFLTSRPGQPQAQKRFAVGVMCCGTIHMSMNGWTNEWWYPCTIVVPCTVGPLAAVVAVSLPWPRTGLGELRQRAALQALAQRTLLAEQFEGFYNKEVVAIATADQLLEIVRDNCTKMKELLHVVHVELFFWPARYQRLRSLVSFFEEQLMVFRSVELTLRKAPTDTSRCQAKFFRITSPHWRAFLKAIAGATDDIVVAERQQRPVRAELATAVREARERLDAACEMARREVMYKGGAHYAPPEPGEDRHLNHCRRIARFFFFDRLAELTEAFAESGMVVSFIPARSEAPKPSSMGKQVIKFLSLPDAKLGKDAIKKTLTIAVLSLLPWVPRLRKHSPQYIWAFIAASFVMSDYAGASISTGLGRATGTLLGGMVGLVSMGIETYYLPREVVLAYYVCVITAWTTGCCLFKASPRHGYLATVSAFSAAIMIVGALENWPLSGENVVLHRTKMQSLGAGVYVLIEILLWPKSARGVVRDYQSSILKLIRCSLVEALGPHASPVDVDTPSPEAASDGTLAAEAPHKALKIADGSPAFHEGNAKVAEAKASVLVAGLEPSLWRKPFPTAMHERLLRSEARALRITAALHAAVRAVPAHEVDPDVPPLVAAYVRAATSSLEATLADLEALSRRDERPRRLFNKSAIKLLAQCGDSCYRPTAAKAAAHLLELGDADRKLRAGMERHLSRFNDLAPNPNATSFSVNTTFFCCLRFTVILSELADRLRSIEAAETMTINV